MLSFIKPTPILITFITAAGILLHDMHIDKATTVAVSTPVIAASAEASDKGVSSNYHTHVERASIPRYNSFRSSLPNIQPPRDDDRRYINNKKLSFMGANDTASLWPSV
ncbi:MAG: hypothetical protein WAR37_02505 [Candidatus Microsaccharimonas sp.]